MNKLHHATWFAHLLGTVLHPFRRTRNYGSPTHLNDYMLKDIGILRTDFSPLDQV